MAILAPVESSHLFLELVIFGAAVFRCRANMAHTRQSRPDSGRGFQVIVLETVQVLPFFLGSGVHKPSAVYLTVTRGRIARLEAYFVYYLEKSSL